MSLFSILKKEDYLMIKWQILFAVVGLALSVLIYLGADYLNNQSVLQLRIAQSDFNSAQTRVEQIEDEEATIIEYIGRYQILDDEGVVRDEDRLQMFERVADIRAANHLFPVSLNIAPQTSLNLTYPPELREPGAPIALDSSVIKVNLPLLHEEDLTRLLDGIIDSPGLYQTRNCEINVQNPDTTRFIILSQHFTATCEILWYTFNLNPPMPDPFGF